MFKRKKLITVIIGAAVIAAVVIGVSIKNADKEAAAIQSGLVEVTTGNIEDRIKGAGVVSANEEFDITTLVTGAVTSSPFEVGDSVREGDVLYTIDCRELEKQITTARISLEKCEALYRQSVAAGNDLTTVSDYGGEIRRLYVSKGDFVQPGAKIADITDSSSLILKIPFNAADMDKIYPGAAADITLASNSAKLHGNVSRIYDSTESLDGYKMVTYVEITVPNPGAIGKGEKAYATVGGAGGNSAGVFEYFIEKSIVSSSGGQIAELNIMEGNRIDKGAVVMRLKNDEVTNAVINSGIAVREAQNALDNLMSKLEDYRVKSPASGTVVSKSVKKGDNAAPATVLMTVSDINNLYVEVEIDEIYIAKITTGLKAEISAEALPGESFTGEVVRIDSVGVAKNGVTYYPVRVRIDRPDALLVGMNLSVEIICRTKENVLLIPREAVGNGSVMLFEGGRLREARVETGIINDSFAEVVSGLEIGDRVSLKRGK